MRWDSCTELPICACSAISAANCPGKLGCQRGTAILCQTSSLKSAGEVMHNGKCSCVIYLQEALRRYKEEVAADPDTSSGFFTNTNAANDSKQYVLVRHHLPYFSDAMPVTGAGTDTSWLAVSIGYASEATTGTEIEGTGALMCHWRALH